MTYRPSLNPYFLGRKFFASCVTCPTAALALLKGRRSLRLTCLFWLHWGSLYPLQPVSLQGGIPHPIVMWYWTGEVDGTEGWVRHMKNDSLPISNTTFDDDRLDYCVTFNKAGRDSLNITLHLKWDTPIDVNMMCVWYGRGGHLDFH